MHPKQDNHSYPAPHKNKLRDIYHLGVSRLDDHISTKLTVDEGY